MTALERAYFNDLVTEFNVFTEHLCYFVSLLQFDTETHTVHNYHANLEQCEAALKGIVVCRNKMADSITMMPAVQMEMRRQANSDK